MNRWEERPIEVANLLNPAFCGAILLRAISEYQRTSQEFFPYALTFLVLPIILHKNTREQIAPQTRVQLHAWIQQHQDVRVGFADRASQLVPITNESIMFLLQLNQLSIDQRGRFEAHTQRQTLRVPTSEEIDDCYRKARIVGRWFARAGVSENVFAMWGVRP
jgi:Family of unknown function (DUF6521)